VRARGPAMVLAAALAVAGGCRSAPHVTDVAGAFAQEWPDVVVRVPTGEALEPWPVVAPPRAMERTVALGRAYLARWPATGRSGRAVRAMLATALLLRGEIDAAVEALEPVHVGVEEVEIPRNEMVRAAVHAVGTCRALQGRLAVDDLLAGRYEPELFVERWGARVGIRLPPEGNPSRDEEILREADQLRRWALRGGDAPTGEQPSVERARQELRRLATENLYDEAAALMAALPAEGRGYDAEGDAQAALACAMFVALGYLSDDLFPERLMAEQKQWQREQVISAYEAARETAARFLTPEQRQAVDDAVNPWLAAAPASRTPAFQVLYARLYDAQLRTIAAIEVRR